VPADVCPRAGLVRLLWRGHDISAGALGETSPHVERG
jgi:hypothetical protein